MEKVQIRVLVVAHSKNDSFAPFVVEQAESLKSAGCIVQMFGIKGKGAFGYLKNLPELRRALKDFCPDVVHAHYGLSGLLVNLQRKYPVITTYHGSDVHSGGWILMLSRLCMKLSRFNIFVSSKLLSQSGYKKKNACVIPCGVDLKLFFPIEKDKARESFAKNSNKRDLVFEPNPVKDSPLAKKAVEILNRRGKDNNQVRLLELKGYSRQEVNLLMNSVDCFLLTSLNEGQPMVIREALAANCPIVSVNVGGVSEVIEGIDGCFLVDRDADSIADSLASALEVNKISSRSDIEKMIFSLEDIRDKLIDIYKLICNSV